MADEIIRIGMSDLYKTEDHLRGNTNELSVSIFRHWYKVSYNHLKKSSDDQGRYSFPYFLGLSHNSYHSEFPTYPTDIQ